MYIRESYVHIHRESYVHIHFCICTQKFLYIYHMYVYDHVCTIDTVTGDLAVNSVFITFRSMRETKKFHFFSFLKTLFYRKLQFPLPW